MRVATEGDEALKIYDRLLEKLKLRDCRFVLDMPQFR